MAEAESAPDRYALVGHPVNSWNDLTNTEASTVINGLDKLRTGEYSLVVNPEGDWQLNIRTELDEDT